MGIERRVRGLGGCVGMECRMGEKDGKGGGKMDCIWMIVLGVVVYV